MRRVIFFGWAKRNPLVSARFCRFLLRCPFQVHDSVLCSLFVRAVGLMSLGVLLECEVPSCVRQLTLHPDQENGFFSLTFVAAQFNLAPDTVRVLDQHLVPTLVVQEAINPCAVLLPGRSYYVVGAAMERPLSLRRVIPVHEGPGKTEGRAPPSKLGHVLVYKMTGDYPQDLQDLKARDPRRRAFRKLANSYELEYAPEGTPRLCKEVLVNGAVARVAVLVSDEQV